ncbi:eukaryotic translation initiation factor 3 subunit G [Aphelenchoides avenae]|nr:eukaryotic translation initiation factor 3 subunit G [Aphelenchus avenae]
MAATLNSNQLGSLAPNSIGSWVDAVDQDSNTGRIETLKDGIKTVIEVVDAEAGGKQQVTTTYKVVKKNVPRVVAQRKEWKKFGAAANDGPGPQPSTTYVAEEVQILFTRNRAGEAEQETTEEKKSDVKGLSKGHCRFCKADDHWSVACPYKEMYQTTLEEDEAEADKVATGMRTGMGTGAPGKYVPPSARGDRAGVVLGERRTDDFTCRVTNLPEDSDTLDEDLRNMFKEAGRIERFFLARDKNTGRPKGFAFITYSNRDDAERAIERFNGAKLQHLILKVEWTRPANT